MKRKSKQMQRLYYSISEVAKMFDVNESTLRFWEKEFDIIQPRKTAKGTRFYRQEDIESVRLIYHLVKEKGLTLAGARHQRRISVHALHRIMLLLHASPRKPRLRPPSTT